MKDYRKPPGLKDKIKKSLGMKVRQKYESIPLLSEEEIREKYKEEDWGFLVNYTKQHRKELIHKYFLAHLSDTKAIRGTKFCPEHKVKLIKITTGTTPSSWVKEYNRICPICGYIGEIGHEMNK